MATYEVKPGAIVSVFEDPHGCTRFEGSATVISVDDAMVARDVHGRDLHRCTVRFKADRFGGNTFLTSRLVSTLAPNP